MARYPSFSMVVSLRDEGSGVTPSIGFLEVGRGRYHYSITFDLRHLDQGLPAPYHGVRRPRSLGSLLRRGSGSDNDRLINNDQSLSQSHWQMCGGDAVTASTKSAIVSPFRRVWVPRQRTVEARCPYLRNPTSYTFQIEVFLRNGGFN